MAKGSLLPENAVGGGAVPDGDYLIKDIMAHVFDYGGKSQEVCAIAVVYQDEAGGDFEQNYSAGNGAKLVEPPDGKRFEIIGKNSNAWAWIGSMLNGGFPKANVDDDVTVFKGCRVTVVNQAQPKRPGLKDQTEGKTIPLVTKVLALPGAKAAAKPATRPTTTAKPAAATPQSAAAPASTSNGELDGEAIAAVLGIIANGPTTRLKLYTAVLTTLAAAKPRSPHFTQIANMAKDAGWLTTQAEAGLLTFDNDTVGMPQ